MQIQFFSEGRLLKVPNCSFLSFSNQPQWSKIEINLIEKTQRLPALFEPILLTIDMENIKKMRFVSNYFWVGSYYLNNSYEEFYTWLLRHSFSFYRGPNEPEILSDILNNLSVRIFHNLHTSYNWSTENQLTIFHLSRVLMTEIEYCKSFLINLEDVESCLINGKTNSKKISLQPVKAIVVEILFKYYRELDFKEQIIFTQNLKKERAFSELAKTPIELDTKSYSDLVIKISKMSSLIIKSLVPNQMINNAKLAEAVNQFTLYSNRDFLVYSPKNSRAWSAKHEYKNKYLRVDHKAYIYSRFGTLLDFNLGQLNFGNLLVEDDHLEITSPLFKQVKFAYLLPSKVPIDKIDNQGISNYLVNNKNISYAKIHIPSLKIAKINKFSLNNLKNLSQSLGWEEILWSYKSYAYLPKAKIDGVLSFR